MAVPLFINWLTGQPLSLDSAFSAETFSTYVPVITANSGTFSSVSATGRFWQIAKVVHCQVNVQITTNGSAASFAIATLPVTPTAAGNYVFAGRANAVSGKMLQGRVSNVGGGTVQIFNYDNTYPGADGEQLVMSGFYEST